MLALKLAVQPASPSQERPKSPEGPKGLDVPRPPSSAPAAERLEEVICFQIHGQELGVPIAAVKETLPAPPLCRLPLCPPFLAGLMNLRGDVVAVLDLGRLLELQPLQEGAPELRRVVLLRGSDRDGRGALCGLLVERLTAARRLRPGDVRPAPAGIAGATAACLRGVASIEGPVAGAAESRRSLLLLDLPRLLQSERLLPFRRGGASPGGAC